MGKRGPAPRPTPLKVLHGVRASRINYAEPIPAMDVVEAPEGLSEAARALWDRLAPDLVRRHVLTGWDVEAFSAWCSAAALAREAAEHIDKEGAVVDAPVFDRNGVRTGERRVKSQWLGVWRDAVDTMARYGARFGMTPSDRAQIKVDAPHSDVDSDLLTGGYDPSRLLS